VVIGTDCMGNCYSNYHTITTMTVLFQCVSFIDAIIPVYGHYCEAHGDCHGITCGVVFTEGFQRHLVKMDVGNWPYSIGGIRGAPLFS
jgi:hypothetical protein